MDALEKEPVSEEVDGYNLHVGDALDLLTTWGDRPIDLIVTDPPYAFGGNGAEHEITATVSVVLRESAKRLRRGGWMIVLCASSWRSIGYMVESVRGECSPVRVGTWAKPVAKTRVRTPGWAWTTVAAVAMRKGPKNIQGLGPSETLDWIEAPAETRGRRAMLPSGVAHWAVAPFAIPGGVFLDPFCGSGALPKAAAALGMESHGFEVSP